MGAGAAAAAGGVGVFVASRTDTTHGPGPQPDLTSGLGLRVYSWKKPPGYTLASIRLTVQGLEFV